MCDGHVLLEDVPGTAKTVLARAIAGSIEVRPPLASSARPTCSRPTSPASRSSTTDPGLRVPARPHLRQRRPRRRDQPRDAEDPVGAARGDGRAPGHRRRRDARAALAAVPAARHRESDRVRRDVPAPRGAARPLLPARGARLSWRRRRDSGSSTSSASRIRSKVASGRRDRRGRTSSRPRRSTSTSTTCCSAGSSTSCGRRASTRRSSSAAPCAGASRSSEPRERGRSSTGAATSSPRTSSGCSCRCSYIESSSRPAYVAQRATSGWEEAIESFRAGMPRGAPRPGSERIPSSRARDR